MGCSPNLQPQIQVACATSTLTWMIITAVQRDENGSDINYPTAQVLNPKLTENFTIRHRFRPDFELKVFFEFIWIQVIQIQNWFSNSNSF